MGHAIFRHMVFVNVTYYTFLYLLRHNRRDMLPLDTWCLLMSLISFTET